MSKITTEDCKKFIKNHFGLTSTVNIKRDRKYKDGNGDYIRVFTFDGATCLIKEDSNGEISLITENEMVAKPTVTATTSSVPQDFDAKKFLKKGIKSLENYNNGDSMDDFIKATNALTKEQKFQIANQFTFFFPDETYYNELNYVTNGLDTLMITNASGELESFCFVFIDCFNTDLDLYVSDILMDMVPTYLDKMDEYHYQLRETSATKKISIRDMIKILEDLGFKYKNNAEWEDNQCMLAKLKIK